MIKTMTAIVCLLVALLLSMTSLEAQVAIGHNNPQESSILDVNATNKGILIPRVSLTTLTSQAPINGQITDGLMVYNTNEQMGKGFYYWANTRWNLLQISGDEKNIYNADGTLTADRNINLDGKHINYLSSNGRPLTLIPPSNTSDDNTPFVFFTNNALTLRVDHTDHTIELKSNGDVRFGRYGKGNITGAVAYDLGIDAFGNLKEKRKNTGLQFLTYNLEAARAAPNLVAIESELKFNRSGLYTGLFNTDAIRTSKTSQNNYYVIKFSGYYEVRNAGVFNFNMTGDDGTRIYIDDGLTLDSWPSFNGTGSITLSRGKHYFEFWYVQYDGDIGLNVSWGANPDGKTGTINASDFTID